MINTDKIIGYVLFVIGVLLLFFSLYEMLIVYTGSLSPPNLFDISDMSLSLGGTNITLIEGAQLSLVPNLFFWFILMVFVMLVGGRIAQVGVTMIKDVKVEVKDALIRSSET